MTTQRQPVGLIGLGLMGTAIAGRLLGVGLPVLGYDIAAAARERLTAKGGRAAADIAEIARTCEYVVVAVFDTSQVEDVVAGPGGLLAVPSDQRRARVAINTSTCDPDRIEALGKRIVSTGLELVELPVSGTSVQVANGDGYGLVGGDEKAAAAVSAVIAAICPRSRHMGALGNGGRAKLAINLVLGLNRAAIAEGLVFAAGQGLDPATFLAAAKDSAAYSQIMDVKGAKMIARDFAPQGRIAQSRKDFTLIADAAASRGQRLTLGAVYLNLMDGCIEEGEADLDNCAVIAELERRAKRE